MEHYLKKGCEGFFVLVLILVIAHVKISTYCALLWVIVPPELGDPVRIGNQYIFDCFIKN